MTGGRDNHLTTFPLWDIGTPLFLIFINYFDTASVECLFVFFLGHEQ